MKDTKDTKSDVDEKVNDFMDDFHNHGMGCGIEIAKVAKIIHPNALAIIPLYRSCIVIEQSEENQKEGDCTIHAYADPHWVGGDINLENLKSDRFHKVYMVQGDRQGPMVNQI